MRGQGVPPIEYANACPDVSHVVQYYFYRGDASSPHWKWSRLHATAEGEGDLATRRWYEIADSGRSYREGARTGSGRRILRDRAVRGVRVRELGVLDAGSTTNSARSLDDLMVERSVEVTGHARPVRAHYRGCSGWVSDAGRGSASQTTGAESPRVTVTTVPREDEASATTTRIGRRQRLQVRHSTTADRDEGERSPREEARDELRVQLTARTRRHGRQPLAGRRRGPDRSARGPGERKGPARAGSRQTAATSTAKGRSALARREVHHQDVQRKAMISHMRLSTE